MGDIFDQLKSGGAPAPQPAPASAPQPTAPQKPDIFDHLQAGSAPDAPSTPPPDHEAGVWQSVKDWYNKDIPNTDHWAATKIGVQNIVHGMVEPVAGAVRAVQNNPRYQDTGEDVHTQLQHMLPGGSQPGGVTPAGRDLASQVTQVPAAIHDINQSPDPTGAYLQAAGKTAGEGAGQAIDAIATEGATRAGSALKTAAPKLSEVPGAVARSVSKTAVTKELQSGIGESLDSVAKTAGIDTSDVSSLREKAQLISQAKKASAQAKYGVLDKASGGRYQRFLDAIDQQEDAIRNTYMNTKDKAAAMKELADTQQAYSDLQTELKAKGVDPDLVDSADADYAQHKAMAEVGKKFKVAENLKGNLKPGTPSVDTGLKNLRPHILKQATGDAGIASDITNRTMNATDQITRVGRNQKLLRYLGGAGVVGTAAELLAGK